MGGQHLRGRVHTLRPRPPPPRTTRPRFTLDSFTLAEPSIYESYVYGSQWMPRPFRHLQASERWGGGPPCCPRAGLTAGGAPLPAHTPSTHTPALPCLPQAVLRARGFDLAEEHRCLLICLEDAEPEQLPPGHKPLPPEAPRRKVGGWVGVRGARDAGRRGMLLRQLRLPPPPPVLLCAPLTPSSPPPPSPLQTINMIRGSCIKLR